MPEAKQTTATLALAAALIAGSMSLPRSYGDPASSGGRTAPVHPVAALAWAQSNCGVKAMLKPGTPRLQAEDFMAMTGELDAHRTKAGRDSVCRQAIRLALRVASDARAGAARDDSAAIALIGH